MDFEVGDIVRGNHNHVNPERTESLGVIVSKSMIVGAAWVVWDHCEKYLAFYDELDLVKRPA